MRAAVKVSPQKASVDSFQCVTRCSGKSSTVACDSRIVVCMDWCRVVFGREIGVALALCPHSLC